MAKSKTRKYSEDTLEFERRRIRAVQKVVDGATQAAVAQEFGVTQGAVSHWMAMYREKGWEGVKAIPHYGRPVIFKKEHSTKLNEIVEKSPYAWGYESDLWTVQMASDVLRDHTGTRFSNTRVLSELHELGFSFQKPQAQAFEKKKTKSRTGSMRYFQESLRKQRHLAQAFTLKTRVELASIFSADARGRGRDAHR